MPFSCGRASVGSGTPGGRAVVIGGGLLGLEAAAALRMRGMEVTVLHIASHLMERQLDPAAGYLLKKDLERRGITGGPWRREEGQRRRTPKAVVRAGQRS